MNKYLILGHAQHGKDTVASILSNYLNAFYIPTSLLISKILIFDVLKNKYNYTDYTHCYEERYKVRNEWVSIINEYNSQDPSRLIKEVLNLNDFYIGLRNIHQFNASKHLFKYILWVDNPYKPKEVFMHIPPTVSHIIINNDCSLSELKHRLSIFLN